MHIKRLALLEGRMYEMSDRRLKVFIRKKLLGPTIDVDVLRLIMVHVTRLAYTDPTYIEYIEGIVMRSRNVNLDVGLSKVREELSR